MPVYVDNAFIPAAVKNGAHTVKAKWCHMMADTREELDAMADMIGLRRSWIQYPGTWKEHYDVTESRRRAAVANGAIEKDAFELAEMRAERRMALRVAPSEPFLHCTQHETWQQDCTWCAGTVAQWQNMQLRPEQVAAVEAAQVNNLGGAK